MWQKWAKMLQNGKLGRTALNWEQSCFLQSYLHDNKSVVLSQSVVLMEHQMVSFKSIKINCITPSNGFIHVTSANEPAIKNAKALGQKWPLYGEIIIIGIYVILYCLNVIKVTGTPPNTNQSQQTGGCGPSAVGGVSCPSQVPPSGGCGGMPCGSPNGTSNG